MQLVGKIVLIQVQADNLKIGQPPHQRYDPMPLRSVPQLILSQRGVSAEVAGDGLIIDIHHRDHPHSKNRKGTNNISLGFTAHYDAMRDTFGPQVTDGIAGENLLVETAFMLRKDDLTAGLLIKRSDGTLIALDHVVVAAPCVEFTRFVLQFPEDVRPNVSVREALRFLNDGMRGYYAAYHGPDTIVSVGDEIFLAEVDGTDNEFPETLLVRKRGKDLGPCS